MRKEKQDQTDNKQYNSQNSIIHHSIIQLNGNTQAFRDLSHVIIHLGWKDQLPGARGTVRMPQGVINLLEIVEIVEYPRFASWLIDHLAASASVSSAAAYLLFDCAVE